MEFIKYVLKAGLFIFGYIFIMEILMDDKLQAKQYLKKLIKKAKDKNKNNVDEEEFEYTKVQFIQKIKGMLTSLKTNQRQLSNLYIKRKDNMTEDINIDILIMTRKGFFAIKVINEKGIVYGENLDNMKIKIRSEEILVKDIIERNENNIENLKKIIGRIKIYNYIVLNDKTDIQVIEGIGESDRYKIVRLSEIRDEIEKVIENSPNLIYEEQLLATYTKLKTYTYGRNKK